MLSLSLKSWCLTRNFERTDQPVFSGKAAVSTVFAGEWSPHQPAHLLVGGLSRGLKLFDIRMLSKSPERSVPWKHGSAHDRPIRALSWSPLVKHWFASASDDATVKVWDLRMNKV